VLVALILLAVLIGTAYTKHLLGLINHNPDNSTISMEEYQNYILSQTDENDPDFTGPVIAPEDVVLNTNTEEVVDEQHIINLMLIGQDRRPGQGRQRSDVMILCSINTETKELNLVSFMRDLYVAIPGYGNTRMNAAYAFGGMNLLSKCMETNFGVHIDGSMEVDFDGFKDVVDMMGGVDLYLTNSEANHMVKVYKVPVQAGMCHLNGEAALAYVRNRSVGNGDFSRTERQRKLLSALVEKCKSMSVAELKTLTETILPLITTDMTNRQIIDYTGKILPMLGQMKVNSHQIPAEGTYQYAMIDNMSVLLPDLEANRKLLKEYIGKD
jgi:LCP family protein required for cell wall assembly